VSPRDKEEIMKPTLRAGIALGLIVTVWMFAFGVTGLYQNFDLSWIYPVVAILIQIGVLVWGLKMTVLEGRRYGGQLGAGLAISVIGAVIILLASFAFGAVFPTDFDAVAAYQADQWAEAGMSEEQIEQTLQATGFMRTPAFGPIIGLIGTLVTGLIVSLIAAAAIRKKD
jgi:hypothetical protein